MCAGFSVQVKNSSHFYSRLFLAVMVLAILIVDMILMDGFRDIRFDITLDLLRLSMVITLSISGSRFPVFPLH